MKAEGKKNDQHKVDDEDGNIDKIRDILFGVEKRENERKLSGLEDKFSKEVRDMREENAKRLDALEIFIKKELTSLSERITKEQNSRLDSVRSINGEIKDFSHEVDKKFTEFGEQTAKNESDIREQILTQSKDLNDEIKKKYNEVLSLLERDTDNLRDEKTDRTALAEMFTEMAMRLTGDFKLPKGE